MQKSYQANAPQHENKRHNEQTEKGTTANKGLPKLGQKCKIEHLEF
jgi:hypothetical protein